MVGGLPEPFQKQFHPFFELAYLQTNSRHKNPKSFRMLLSFPYKQINPPKNIKTSNFQIAQILLQNGRGLNGVAPSPQVSQVLKAPATQKSNIRKNCFVEDS